MHGYIDRCQMEPDDPVDILFRHIGKRNVISLQEGKSGIIILKIQSFPHSLWHLVNKTEHTLVMAGMVFIHQTVFKHKSDILRIILLNLQLPFFATCFPYQKHNIFFLDQKLIIKYIFDFFSVYSQQKITGFNLHFLTNAARFYFFYFMLVLFLKATACQIPFGFRLVLSMIIAHDDSFPAA